MNNIGAWFNQTSNDHENSRITERLKFLEQEDCHDSSKILSQKHRIKNKGDCLNWLHPDNKCKPAAKPKRKKDREP